MEVGGRRAVWCAAAALATAMAVGGCAPEDPREPARAGPEATEAAPTPSPSPSPPQEPKALIVQAFRTMQVAFERKDARSAVRHMAPLALRDLRWLQRITATGGPAQIDKLTIWQKLVLTMLRTDHDEDLIGGLSPEAFLDHVFSYDLDYFPSASLRSTSVKITSPREAVAVIGGSPVWFELVDDEWKVDVRGVFEGVSFFTKRFAKEQGMTTDEVVMTVAEERTTGAVPADVWQKPD